MTFDITTHSARRHWECANLHESPRGHSPRWKARHSWALLATVAAAAGVAATAGAVLLLLLLTRACFATSGHAADMCPSLPQWKHMIEPPSAGALGQARERWPSMPQM